MSLNPHRNRPERLQKACGCHCHDYPGVYHVAACCNYGPIQQHEYDELRAFDGPYY